MMKKVIELILVVAALFINPFNETIDASQHSSVRREHIAAKAPARAGKSGHGSAVETSGPRFEKAIEIIKKYETLHKASNWPYVGYGHRVKKGEHIARGNMSEKAADKLLREDLKEYVTLFKDYGKDALLLAVLAYNVGPYKLLGHGKHKKSNLIEKLDAGNRSIKHEYMSYSTYRGRAHKMLTQRRTEEFEALYHN